MRRIGKLKNQKVKKLTVKGLNQVSLVNEPANQHAFAIEKALTVDITTIKKDKEQDIMKNKRVEPLRLRFKKSVYGSADMVKGVLMERGYAEFDEVKETDSEFIVEASAEELAKFTGETKEIEISKGLIAETAIYTTEEDTEEKQKSEGGDTEEAGEGTGEGSEDSTTTGQQGEGDDGDKPDSPESAEKSLKLDGPVDVKAKSVEEQKEEYVLKVKGLTVPEILENYTKLLSTVQKGYAPWACEFTGAENFSEALASAGWDGEVPGMYEVMETLNSFVKSSFLMGNTEVSKKAFDEAGAYIQGLKKIFDEFAMSEFAKSMLFQAKEEKKAEDTVKAKTEVNSEKGNTDAIQDLIKAHEKRDAELYDDVMDALKANLEVGNANLIKANQEMKEQITKLQKSLEKALSVEPSRDTEDIDEEVESTKNHYTRSSDGLGVDWTKALIS